MGFAHCYIRAFGVIRFNVMLCSRVVDVVSFICFLTYHTSNSKDTEKSSNFVREWCRDVNVLVFLDFSFRYDSVHQKY